MYALDCAVSESLIRPLDASPLLSIIVPTYNRPEELRVAVESLCAQITDAMKGKIEIVIVDNASLTGSSAVKALAEAFADVGYILHQKNQGMMFQIYAAPSRARGRWTWCFGDDDALEDGGLAYVIDILETHQPAFLSLNRQVLDAGLANVISPSKHSAPEQGFATFVDFLEDFGLDQVTFITSQIVETERVRSVDPHPYLESPSVYGQVAWYLEAFHGASSYYGSRPVVKHRWDPQASAHIAANFHQLATLLPVVLEYSAVKSGLPRLAETINGTRSNSGEGERRITFVDNVLQNLWRAIGHGRTIPDAEWTDLQAAAGQWRADRVEHVGTAKKAYDIIRPLEETFANDLASFNSARKRMANGGPKKKMRALEEQRERLLEAQAHLNASRQSALEISDLFA